MDKQSCHTTLVSGAVYARGIEEAPGHVKSRRAEYRQISRGWHSWLGFVLYLGSRAGGFDGSCAVGALKRIALDELDPNLRLAKRV